VFLQNKKSHGYKVVFSENDFDDACFNDAYFNDHLSVMWL
jgi:hypothetical protein